VRYDHHAFILHCKKRLTKLRGAKSIIVKKYDAALTECPTVSTHVCARSMLGPRHTFFSSISGTHFRALCCVASARYTRRTDSDDYEENDLEWSKGKRRVGLFHYTFTKYQISGQTEKSFDTIVASLASVNTEFCKNFKWKTKDCVC